MRPSELPDQIVLHDSVVRRVDWDEQARALRIDLTLCNFMQDDYREDQPENVDGALVFTGVSRVEAEPDLGSLRWDERLSGGILTADAAGDDGVKLVVDLTYYPSKERVILVLQIHAADAAWTPRAPG